MGAGGTLTPSVRPGRQTAITETRSPLRLFDLSIVKSTHHQILLASPARLAGCSDDFKGAKQLPKSCERDSTFGIGSELRVTVTVFSAIFSFLKEREFEGDLDH